MNPPITFAIGDIHGCHQALLNILKQCRDYAKGEAHRLVFIGDYIDRGPDSRSVIATIRDLEEHYTGEVICLKGNHEDMLLDAVERHHAKVARRDDAVGVDVISRQRQSRALDREDARAHDRTGSPAR